MQKKKKEKWGKPKLIILTKVKPEESVLTSCKDYTNTNIEPESANGAGCAMTGPALCTACWLIVSG